LPGHRTTNCNAIEFIEWSCSQKVYYKHASHIVIENACPIFYFLPCLFILKRGHEVQNNINKKQAINHVIDPINQISIVKITMFFGDESKLVWEIAAIIDSQNHHNIIPVCSERVIGLQQ